MFNTTKRNSRNKLLSVRLSLEEMTALNKIIKETDSFNNKTDFIRHLVLTSPEYVLYTKRNFEESTASLAHFESLLEQENYHALKPYYNKYFNLKIKTHQRYLQTLEEEAVEALMYNFTQESIQLARQGLIKEARTWRNIYEEAVFAFNNAQIENQKLVDALDEY